MIKQKHLEIIDKNKHFTIMSGLIYPNESSKLLGIAILLHKELLCYDKIGVELKAFTEITGEFESQLINYLHVGNHQLGLLLNFGANSLQYKWIPNRKDYKKDVYK